MRMRLRSVRNCGHERCEKCDILTELEAQQQMEREQERREVSAKLVAAFQQAKENFRSEVESKMNETRRSSSVHEGPAMKRARLA